MGHFRERCRYHARQLSSLFISYYAADTIKWFLRANVEKILNVFRRTLINVSMTTSQWSFITIITKSNADAKIRSWFRRSNKSRFATDNKLRAHTLTPPCGQKVSFYSSSFNLSSTTIMVEDNPSRYELSPLDNKETVKTRKYFPCQIKWKWDFCSTLIFSSVQGSMKPRTIQRRR